MQMGCVMDRNVEINVGAGSSGPNMMHDPIIKGGKTPPLRPGLVHIMGYFKYETTKQINQLRVGVGFPGPNKLSVWQRSYHDRVIRDEVEHNKSCEYIEANPTQWEFDEENIQGVRDGA